MIRLWANPKVNLGLRVLARRQDGYHELQSVFCPLEFPRDDISIELSGNGLQLFCQELSDKNNIISRAYLAFADKTGFRPGMHVILTKRIPMGAGLGGGSSDAAVFLKWLNHYCGAPLDSDALANIGLELGADVPFFLLNRPAFVEGIGEKIEPINFTSNFYIVVVWPQIEIDTAWAFHAFDQSGKGVPTENNLTKSGLKATENSPNGTFCPVLGLSVQNDLEDPVAGHFPELVRLKSRIQKTGAISVAMSGSGSSFFGVFADFCRARNAARELRQHYKYVFLSPCTQSQ